MNVHNDLKKLDFAARRSFSSRSFYWEVFFTLPRSFSLDHLDDHFRGRVFPTVDDHFGGKSFSLNKFCHTFFGERAK